MFFLLTAAGGLAVGVVSAAMYKWTDENGTVYYSDKMPMEAQKSEKTVLDRQGRTVKHIESEKQYLRRLEEENKKKEDGEEKPTVYENRDRALTLSYLTENDIDLARDRAVHVLDGQIESAAAVIEQLEARQEKLLQRQEAGQTIPEGELKKLHADMESRRNTMTRYYGERQKVIEKYEADKKRWRELKVIEEQRLREKEAEKIRKN